MKGTVIGDKEQGVGIKGKTEVEFDTEDQVLFDYLPFHQYLIPLKQNTQCGVGCGGQFFRFGLCFENGPSFFYFTSFLKKKSGPGFIHSFSCSIGP